MFTLFEVIASAYTAPTNEMSNAFPLTSLTSSAPATLYPERSSLECRKAYMRTTPARSKSEPTKTHQERPSRMSIPIMRPDANLRSRRLPRPKATRCCLPRARSPSPDPFLLDPSDVEPFPEVGLDGWEEWKKNSVTEGWISYPSFIEHCTRHCTHYVCESMVHFNKRKGVEDPECSCVQFPTSESKGRQEQERISNLTHEDVAQAELLYQNTSKDRLITLELASATALVHKLDQMRFLDIESHLPHSPRFPKRSPLHPLPLPRSDAFRKPASR